MSNSSGKSKHKKLLEKAAKRRDIKSEPEAVERVVDMDALRGFFWLGMVVCERCWTTQPNTKENREGVYAAGCQRCGNLTGRYISQ